jgi:hypothetical protein
LNFTSTSISALNLKQKFGDEEFNFPKENKLRKKYNKSPNIYLQFIEEAKERAKKLLLLDNNTYVEKHHIVPKHAGGSDDKENLVNLTYEDHVLAHYIRWIEYKNPNDKLAFSVMSGQNIDIRKERAKLGGIIGGPLGQEILKKENKGWFNSEEQSKRGKKGAETNRINKTGAWDSDNLKKANKILSENPDLYKEQKIKNLAKGLLTQKEKGINIADPLKQRLKSLKYHGVLLNGVRYSIDIEQRTYLSETTLDYYIKFGELRPR